MLIKYFDSSFTFLNSGSASLSHSFDSAHAMPAAYLGLWKLKITFTAANMQRAFLIIAKYEPYYKENYAISQNKMKVRNYFTGISLKSSEIFRG